MSGGGSTTQNSKFDKFGNPIRAQLSCCTEKQRTFGQNTYWSQPEQQMSGDPIGVNLTESASYNFNDGTVASNTNPQGQTTSFTYDTFGRLGGYTLPTAATGSASYNIWGLSTGSSFVYDDGGTNKTLVTSVVYDGWGQVIQTVDKHGAQVNIAYDNMGRVQSRTNPFPQGGTPELLTTYQYDVLGRTSTILKRSPTKPHECEPSFRFSGGTSRHTWTT